MHSVVNFEQYCIKEKMTEELIEKVAIIRIKNKTKTKIEDIVIEEAPLTIFLNNEELVTLVCTPNNLKYLVVGFLYSAGFIKEIDDIKKLVIDEEKMCAYIDLKEDKKFIKKFTFERLILPGCSKAATFHTLIDKTLSKKVNSKIKITATALLNLVKMMHREAKLYQATGGTHCACICDNSNILAAFEDISRHNTIDKIIGYCILTNTETSDKIIITSGRVAQDLITKLAKCNVPIIISKSAPTNIAVKLANELNITLIGFVRGKRMNIYTHPERVV